MSDQMSTALSVFENDVFGKVRAFARNGEPWFVANDVATALGYSDPNDAVRRHCKYAELLKGGESPVLNVGPRGTNIIPESDVYALIFRSNLPKAEEFRRWVCEEVLPSLRKTGQYSLAVPNFANPAEAARAWADEYEAKQKALALVEEQRQTIEAQEIALGDNRDWKAVTAIPWLRDYFIDTSVPTCSRIGKALSALSRSRGYEIRKAEDDRWGTVNVYHIDVIAGFKAALDRDIRVLMDIRR